MGWTKKSHSALVRGVLSNKSLKQIVQAINKVGDGGQSMSIKHVKVRLREMRRIEKKQEKNPKKHYRRPWEKHLKISNDTELFKRKVFTKYSMAQRPILWSREDLDILAQEKIKGTSGRDLIQIISDRITDIVLSSIREKGLSTVLTERLAWKNKNVSVRKD